MRATRGLGPISKSRILHRCDEDQYRKSVNRNEKIAYEIQRSKS